MSIYVRESNLMPIIKNNRKYLTAEEKKNAYAILKHQAYIENQSIHKLNALRQYYIKKLKSEPGNEETIRKIEEIDFNLEFEKCTIN